METLLQLFSFVSLFTMSVEQIVSNVKEDLSGGHLNDDKMPSQLALCIFLKRMYIINVVCNSYTPVNEIY